MKAGVSRRREDESYWLVKSEAADREPEPADPLPRAAEVVVVGAGVAGVAVTYWLARMGVDVALVEEQGCLAAGASGRNAGLYLPASGNLEDPTLLREVMQLERMATSLDVVGHLSLASTPGTWSEFNAEVERTRGPGQRVTTLDRAACEELLGLQISRRYRGGRWFPGGGVINPVSLVTELAEAARRRGARITTATKVTRIGNAGSRRPLVVSTNRGRVAASRIVLACGAGIGSLCPPLSAVLTSTRAQMLVTRPLPPLFGTAMAVDYGRVYWRQVAGGEVLIGGYADLDPTRGNANGSVTAPVQDALERFLPEVFPAITSVQVTKRWASELVSTPDGKPVAGPVRDHPYVFVLGGFGGHGLPPALALAKAVAESVTGDRPPDTIDSLAPDRFDQVQTPPPYRSPQDAAALRTKGVGTRA
jgi:sarcosine oxidase subunit beta